MKKASKKLLSFFLAVVMVVTSCSVGFTAFAEEPQETYWNDVTEADEAFDAIGEIVNIALPLILGIDTGNGKTVGQLLNMTDEQIKSATLQTVIEKASPLLGGLLGVSITPDLKEFIIGHPEITGINSTGSYKVPDPNDPKKTITKKCKTWQDKYYSYFSYLNEPSKDGAPTFIELYTFCENNMDSSNDEVKEYCTRAIESLNALLKKAVEAEQAYDDGNLLFETFMKALVPKVLNSNAKNYTDGVALTFPVSISASDIGAKELSANVNVTNPSDTTDKYVIPKGVAIDDLTKSETYTNAKLKDASGIIQAAIDYADKQLKAIGVNKNITTLSEAVVYYYGYPSGKDSGNGKGPVSVTNGFLLHPYNSGIFGGRTGINYYTAVKYIQLAEKGGKCISTSRIDGTEALTSSNYEAVLKNCITALRDSGDPRYADYQEGVNEYYFFAKAVFDCLNDTNSKVVEMQTSTSAANNVKLETLGSTSYDAINIANLIDAGVYPDIESAKKAIEKAKITEDQFDKIIDKAVSLSKAGKSDKDVQDGVRNYITSSELGLSNEAKYFFGTYYGTIGTEFRDFVTNISKFQDLDGKPYTREQYLEKAKSWKTFPGSTASKLMYASTDGKELNPVDWFNLIVSGVVTNLAFGVGGTTNTSTAVLAVSSPIYDHEEILRANSVKKALETVSYNYEDFKMSPTVKAYYDDKYAEDSINAVNDALNTVVKGALDPSTELGGIISTAISGLMESTIVLYNDQNTGLVNNIWLKLYEAPMETVFNILPVLVILIEEVVSPMLINGEGDERYRALDAILENLGISLTAQPNPGQYELLNTDLGIVMASFDLNKILPGLLAYLKGDIAKAKEICGTYDDFLNGECKIDKESYKDKVNGEAIMLLGVYKVDKALAGLDLRAELGKKMDATAADGVYELIMEIVGFAYDAVTEYLAECEADPTHKDYRYSPHTDGDCVVTQRGLNNIAISLPRLIDKIGKKFIAKYNVSSDWAFVYQGKLDLTKEKSFRNGITVTQYYNAPLEAFKEKAVYDDAKKNAAEVLDLFMEAFTGSWINALLDIVNDTVSTSNKLTDNLALIAGLLDSLGGIGEKSILTDVFNGLFDLTRQDEASFTFEVQNPTKGFVGLSKQSGYFLISNIVFDSGKRGIIPLVKSVINAPKYGPASSGSSSSNTTTTETKKPTLVTSSKMNKKYDASEVLTKKNVGVADALLEKLDKILASLLDNASLNDFVLNSNENILAGVLTAVSNYIGEKNTNALLNLLDSYLQVFDTTAKDGKVDASEVYTSKNLSNIVINTYKLIEAIALRLLYSETGVLTNGDPNHVILGAITGLISPDALSVRVSAHPARDLAGKASWNEVREIDFDVSSGNKEEFYDALGESLSTVAAVLGAVLTYSYTDSSKKDNLYSGVLEPVLSAVAKHTGASGVLAPDSFNSLDGHDQLIKGILTPLANILSQFYKAPASFLVNLVGSLGDILNDDALKDIINSVVGIVNNVFGGLANVLGGKDMLNAPSLVKYIGIALASKTDLFTTNLTFNINLPEKDIIVTLLRNINIGSLNKKLGEIIALKPIDWKALANAKSAGEKLLLVFSYLVDVLLSSPIILGLVKDAAPELVKLLESLTPAQILAIISAILDVTQSPTEVFWTFKEYAGKITNTFVYPKGITAAEADEAVDNLDKLVKNVFPLLKDLGVLDYEDLPQLVGSLLYKNELLTKLTTTVYGGIYDAAKKAEITDLLKGLGLDLSPAGIANILMDESYGKTYSSAAKTLKKAKSWSKVKTINWGFKDGSDKAQIGFINALAAILRPINGVLSIFLAEGKGLDMALTDDAKDEILNMIKDINVDLKSVGGIKQEDPYGCDLKLGIKNGVLTLVIDSNGSDKDSTFKLNIANVAATLLNELSSDNPDAGFGTNGYENAVIPLLEAFLREDLMTYDEYVSEYEDAKDNLLINIFKPIISLVDDVLAAPANTLTAILPNLAYFIDSNGLAQAVSNLLAPITAKNGVIGILKSNGIDVDKLIKTIAGKSLGKIVTDALGINVKLNLTLTDLSKCNIQDIVLPLVNTLLKKNNISIKIPKFTFAEIASHGKIVTADSAAKNSKGEYERLMVEADKGEMFVALLRYVGDVLIKNATALNKLLGGIDAIKNNKTISDILNCVFSSLKVANKDDIVRAVFYFLTQHGAQDSFFDYSNFISKKYDFSFGNMDEAFCRQLAPMLDGLVGGLLADKGGLLGLLGGMIYTDDIISSLACGLYGAIDGVNIDGIGSLSALLAKTDIDFTAPNVAKLLTDKRYGKTYDKAARVIANAGSWKNVKKEDLKWGVKDRETFLGALTAVLRPVFGVLDVLLNNGNLNLFNIVSVPGSNGYTSFIVPLLEAFGVYNIKTQYDYRMDMEKAYDAILLDILNPLWDKVEDILNAPIEMLADILPNLSLFFANNGLLQLIDNLLTPVSALLNAVKPIINVNVVLDVLGVDLNALLGKIGVKANVKVDVYDLKSTLEPLIGSDNVVSLLNGILGVIKIKGQPLGLELPEIDWFRLASHGKVYMTTSQVATFGTRMAVQADQDETLIAVLRFLIDTINYKNNYDTIVNLVSGLLGGAGDSISGVIDQVLGMLKGDSDTVIESLVELLQSFAG
ncbi:hypothetical protein [uncultured Eubacterium sp.]|uniref:hypothetical protein n=1 Tax=uncultured Eubacterium sp. TaxID=165185 RepID=UPI0015B84184|nr:hypothetical protein [uncultured Eubacterium sp.]